MRLFFVLLIISGSSFGGHAQSKKAKLQLYIDQGVELMTQKEYELAQDKFKTVIDQLTPLPGKMAFYFGKNSYHLKQYKQSINWLNKYIQLKGTSGTYYKECKEYLALAENAFLEAHKHEIAQMENNLDNDFDCYSKDKMVCPACKGSGVMITKGTLQNHYQTCPFSGGDGYLTCAEYNLYMKGLLKPKSD